MFSNLYKILYVSEFYYFLSTNVNNYLIIIIIILLMGEVRTCNKVISLILNNYVLAISIFNLVNNILYI